VSDARTGDKLIDRRVCGQIGVGLLSVSACWFGADVGGALRNHRLLDGQRRREIGVRVALGHRGRWCAHGDPTGMTLVAAESSWERTRDAGGPRSFAAPLRVTLSSRKLVSTNAIALCRC